MQPCLGRLPRPALCSHSQNRRTALNTHTNTTPRGCCMFVKYDQKVWPFGSNKVIYVNVMFSSLVIVFNDHEVVTTIGDWV